MENKDFLEDDEPIDPKKFFDEKEYSTLIVGRDGFSKKQNDTADLIETLLSKDVTRKEAEEIFSKLKDLNAQAMMVKALEESTSEKNKAKICAACWESGLDFTPYFLLFTEFACGSDFSLAMEALTVVENMEGNINELELTKGLELVQNSKSPNAGILEDLATNIRQRIH
ncbi:MAG: hypothetical protein K0S32_411 [Bacteroidetes bacterium]|jgi:hypothetical protein|nr:hypothetical protein [Bacteroidota bacterium]